MPNDGVRAIQADTNVQEIDTESVSHPEDRVSDDVVEAAKAVFSRRSNGDLMVLMHDSLVDEDHAPDRHVLRFEHRRLSVEVEVSVARINTSLQGSTSVPTRGRFEVMVLSSKLVFIQDSDDGTFAFGPLGHGLVRITFEPVGAGRLVTDWFLI